MKYVSFEGVFNKIPLCSQNMRLALRRLGEIDPLDIQKTTLKKTTKFTKHDFDENDYINRGVLNVRKTMNRHLGRSGKFTNRMINNASLVNTYKEEDSAYMRIKLPGKDFIRIVVTTYTLLYNFDAEFCNNLLQNEQSDNYGPKISIENPVIKAIVPIQTNIVIRSCPNTDMGNLIKKLLCNMAQYSFSK